MGGLEVHFLRRLKRNIDGLQILIPIAYANPMYGRKKSRLSSIFVQAQYNTRKLLS